MSRLAREFTSLVVGEPHVSLRFSENLLLDDSHYYRVFSTDHDLDLYTIVLDVHVRIGEFLASFMEDKALLGDTAENWRYHLAYMASFTLTRLRRPTQRDLLNVKIEHLSDELLESMMSVLEREYKASLRGNRAQGIDKVARSSDFTRRVRQATVATRRFQINR